LHCTQEHRVQQAGDRADARQDHDGARRAEHEEQDPAPGRRQVDERVGCHACVVGTEDNAEAGRTSLLPQTLPPDPRRDNTKMPSLSYRHQTGT